MTVSPNDDALPDGITRPLMASLTKVLECRRRPRFAPVGFLVLMWMSAAHSQEQKNAAGSHADLMPEDLQKFNKLLEEDGFDIQSSDPTDWTKWATVLSHVCPTLGMGIQTRSRWGLSSESCCFYTAGVPNEGKWR